MTEHVPNHGQEQIKSIETEADGKLQEASPRHEAKLDTNEKHPDDSIESIRQKIHQEAAKAREPESSKEAGGKKDQPLYVNRELRAEALRRSLNRIRKHLNKPQRVFSKAIHQPAVDTVSKAGAKTIARPTGLLTASIVALAGSSYLLWNAKHYGYQYNYLAVVLFFVAGYVLGLIIEFLFG